MKVPGRLCSREKCLCPAKNKQGRSARADFPFPRGKIWLLRKDYVKKRVSSKHTTPAAQGDSFELDTITVPSCQGLLQLLIHENNRQAVSSPALYRFCWQKQRAMVFWGLTRLEVIDITWSCARERLQHALPPPNPCKPYLQSQLCAHPGTWMG